MGMTKAEFGRRINTSRQNVNSLLRKASLDTAHLLRIGEALKYDFFQHFSAGGEMSPMDRYGGQEAASVKILIEIPRDQQDQLLDLILGKGRLELLNQVFTKG